MSDESASLVPELRATLGKLEVALGAIADAIVWTDQQGRIQWCNAAFDRLVSRRHLEVLGASLTACLPLRPYGTGSAGQWDPVQQAVATMRPTTTVYEFPNGGPSRLLEVFSTVARLGQAAPSIVLVMRDITERARAEETLKTKIGEVESLNRVMMGREERILELKEEVRKLRDELADLRQRLSK